jgi:hypothetical protein
MYCLVHCSQTDTIDRRQCRMCVNLSSSSLSTQRRLPFRENTLHQGLHHKTTYVSIRRTESHRQLGHPETISLCRVIQIGIPAWKWPRTVVTDPGSILGMQVFEGFHSGQSPDHKLGMVSYLCHRVASPFDSFHPLLFGPRRCGGKVFLICFGGLAQSLCEVQDIGVGAEFRIRETVSQ